MGEVAEIASLGGGEWEGSKSRWHIPTRRRDQADPGGPFHWPRRPANVAGFCDSIGEQRGQERRHAYDPPSGLPHPSEREQQWRSSSKHVEPYQPQYDRPGGKKALVPLSVDENKGWTGTRNNFTGPKHFTPLTTTVEPTESTATKSYYLEKVIGTKKAVYSEALGLVEHYGGGERRCERPTFEWSVDSKMQRKIRVPSLEDRRNGIGLANPGDKGYGTAEHAPEYAAMLLAENRGRGNIERKVMSKIDKSWSQSGSDPLMDKKGRRMCDYIQIYCRTPYRKNSMYVHRNAEVREVAEMAGEGGSGKKHISFKGQILPAEATLRECGVGAKSTLELLVEEEVPERKITWSHKELLRTRLEEADEVSALGTLNLEDKYPAADRDDYNQPE